MLDSYETTVLVRSTVVGSRGSNCGGPPNRLLPKKLEERHLRVEIVVRHDLIRRRRSEDELESVYVPQNVILR